MKPGMYYREVTPVDKISFVVAICDDCAVDLHDLGEDENFEPWEQMGGDKEGCHICGDEVGQGTREFRVYIPDEDGEVDEFQEPMDIVFYSSTTSTEEVRSSLINHDGYPSNIVVIQKIL